MLYFFQSQQWSFWVPKEQNSERILMLCSRRVFSCLKLEQEVELTDLSTHISLLSQRIGKDLSSPNVDLISPLPPSSPHTSLCLYAPTSSCSVLFSALLHVANFFSCSSNALFLSQRSFGWRTTWQLKVTPSSWCRTTRACWLSTSASQACLMGADTPARPSMNLEKTRWNASWRFEVCRLNASVLKLWQSE